MQNTTREPIQLDVRPIPPREKHPAIFATFDALSPGESFILVNDHDPFPLRYQFQAERAGKLKSGGNQTAAEAVGKAIAELFDSNPGPTAPRLGRYLFASMYQGSAVACAMRLIEPDMPIHTL